MATATTRPWDELAEMLAAEADATALESYLDGLTDGDVVLAVSRLDAEARAHLLATLDPDEAADLVELLPETQVVEALEDLPPNEAARIVEELPSNEQADLLGDLHEPEAEAILAEMKPGPAQRLRRLAAYPDDVAGGLMITERLAYRPSRTVAAVVSDLRLHAEEYQDYDIQYIYVLTRVGRLLGVLRMRDLLLAPESQRVRDLMRRDTETVPDDMSLEELRRLFERHPYYGVPVVDAQQRLLGIVQRADVEEAVTERTERDFQRVQGVISGEELRSMPLLLRSRRRLAWLAVNVVLNILAATVIAFHEDTLTAVIALAVFLPIISDMSGCSGNQAVAVTLRELSLGVVAPTEARRVWRKELGVGVINGIVLGLLVALAAWAWKGNPWLGLVVGTAMAVNTLVAVSLGGTLPLILRRVGVDPALAAGPLLTTVTDMAGFLLVLSLASSLLPRLVS